MLLLDTNIVSYMVKDDSRISLYLVDLYGQQWAIALMTMAELMHFCLSRSTLA